MKHRYAFWALLCLLQLPPVTSQADLCNDAPPGGGDPDPVYPWFPAYSIKFPGDATLADCDDPAPDLELENLGCGLLAVNRDTLRYETAGDCSKMQITYKVINWCEYDGGPVLTPTVIPRDLDEDNDLEECTWLEASYDPDFVKHYIPHAYSNDGWHKHRIQYRYGVVRLYGADEYGYRKPWPEKVLLSYVCPDYHGHHSGPHVGYLIYSLKGIGYKGYPVYKEECSRSPENLCRDYYAKPCWSPGYYSYTRLIKVKDNVPPRIIVDSEDLSFCAYGNGQANCDGLVAVDFSITGFCFQGAARVRSVRFLQEGSKTPVDATGTLYKWANTEGNRWRVWGRFPEGNHRFLVQVGDDCGNVRGGAIDFEVVDCQPPAPVCLRDLRIVLMRVDTDGDGLTDGWANTIPAYSFVASNIDDCNRSAPAPQNVLYYAIKETDLEGGDPAAITPGDLTEERSSVAFTCADPAAVKVFVVALDGAGNFSYCTVTVVRRPGRFGDPCAPAANFAGQPAADGLNPPDNLGEPAGMELYQNVPNPARAGTRVSFYLPEPGPATLEIRDLSGRMLKQTGGDFDRGYNEVRLSAGELPAEGVLLYTLRTEKTALTRRMVVLK